MNPTPRCDFCGAPDPTWRTPTHSHTSAARTGIDLGGGLWSCHTCTQLINTDDIEQLLPRVTAHQQHDTGPLPPEASDTAPARRAELLIALFRMQRTGDPHPYTRKAKP